MFSFKEIIFFLINNEREREIKEREKEREKKKEKERERYKGVPSFLLNNNIFAVSRGTCTFACPSPSCHSERFGPR